MLIIQILVKNQQPFSISCIYNDLFEISYILDLSKEVKKYNVTMPNQGFLKNLYDRTKWIDKSFNEFYGDDD